jgi:hypothetical protein
MLIKSYKKGNVEIIVSQNENDTYNVLKVDANNPNDKSNYKPNMTYEDADDIFDFWLEESMGLNTNDCE